MAGFQKVVLYIALAVLILALIIIAAMISVAMKNEKWPPEVATCPPYYTVERDTAANTVKCKRDSNMPAIGASVCTEHVLFDGTRASSNQEKCQWAKDCQIQWDGISASDCAAVSASSDLVSGDGSNIDQRLY